MEENKTGNVNATTPNNEPTTNKETTAIKDESVQAVAEAIVETTNEPATTETKTEEPPKPEDTPDTPEEKPEEPKPCIKCGRKTNNLKKGICGACLHDMTDKQRDEVGL